MQKLMMPEFGAWFAISCPSTGSEGVQRPSGAGGGRCTVHTGAPRARPYRPAVRHAECRAQDGRVDGTVGGRWRERYCSPCQQERQRNGRRDSWHPSTTSPPEHRAPSSGSEGPASRLGFGQDVRRGIDTPARCTLRYASRRSRPARSTLHAERTRPQATWTSSQRPLRFTNRAGPSASPSGHLRKPFPARPPRQLPRETMWRRRGRNPQIATAP